MLKKNPTCVHPLPNFTSTQVKEDWVEIAENVTPPSSHRGYSTNPTKWDIPPQFRDSKRLRISPLIFKRSLPQAPRPSRSPLAFAISFARKRGSEWLANTDDDGDGLQEISLLHHGCLLRSHVGSVPLCIRWSSSFFVDFCCANCAGFSSRKPPFHLLAMCKVTHFILEIVFKRICGMQLCFFFSTLSQTVWPDGEEYGNLEALVVSLVKQLRCHWAMEGIWVPTMFKCSHLSIFFCSFSVRNQVQNCCSQKSDNVDVSIQFLFFGLFFTQSVKLLKATNWNVCKNWFDRHWYKYLQLKNGQAVLQFAFTIKNGPPCAVVVISPCHEINPQDCFEYVNTRSDTRGGN